MEQLPDRRRTHAEGAARPALRSGASTTCLASGDLAETPAEGAVKQRTPGSTASAEIDCKAASKPDGLDGSVAPPWLSSGSEGAGSRESRVAGRRRRSSREEEGDRGIGLGLGSRRVREWGSDRV